MQRYMDCLRNNESTSSPCRVLSKEYLDCRMNRSVNMFKCRAQLLNTPSSGLMERDEWKNLGLANLKGDKSEPSVQPKS